MVRLAKRLKKEKVNVDIISFGEEVGPSRVHGGATIDTVSYIPYVLSCLTYHLMCPGGECSKA